MSYQQENRRIAKNTLFLYIRLIFVLFINIYTSRVILEALGLVDFGIYNVVAGFVSMFAFLNTSLIACVQRFYNYELGANKDGGFQNVYVASLIIQIILAFLVVIVTECVGIWYINEQLVVPPDRLQATKVVFHTSVLSIVFVIIQVPYSAAIVAKERISYYALVGIIDVVLKLSVVFILPYINTDTLSAYGWLLLGVSAVDFFLYFIYFKTKFKTRIEKVENLSALIRSMISFSGWSTLGSLAQITKNQGLNIILNLFFGPIVNAARAVSFQIKSALVGFMGNIVTASRPQIVESYASRNFERAKSLFFSVSKISFLLMFLMVLPVAAEIDYILELWLGSNVPDYTDSFTLVILIIALIDIYNWPISVLIYASGKIRKYNVLTSITGLFVLPISYFMLKMGGSPISVYIVSLIISIIVQIQSVYILSETTQIGVLEYLQKVIVPTMTLAGCSLFVPFMIVSSLSPGFARLIIVTIVSSLTICTIAYFVVLTKNERQKITSLLQQKLHL